jgi:phospholipid/cholesterol/gamma-HCH transport system permease protein
MAGRVSALAEPLGGMTQLLVQTARSAVRLPPVWWSEFVRQMALMLRVTLLPILIAIPAYAFGAPGLQGGGNLSKLGEPERVGGVIVYGVIREFGTFVTASVVAAIVGTAITAEFGARRAREELDALQVLGTDLIRSMVVPRVAAVTVLMLVLTVVTLVGGTLGGLLAAVLVFKSTVGGFVSAFFLNTSYIDVLASLVKSVLLGVIIAVICCYKGLTASGGAEGVGRAVNQAVVACLVSIFFVSLVYGQVYAALFPGVQVIR